MHCSKNSQKNKEQIRIKAEWYLALGGPDCAIDMARTDNASKEVIDYIHKLLNTYWKGTQKPY